MSGPILVFTEFRNGAPCPESLEALSGARRLAELTGSGVTAAVLGNDVASFAGKIVGVDGVDRVVAVEDAALEPFLAGPWAAAVTSVVTQVWPRAVLIPSSITGRDYAARVAARIGAGMASDVVALGVNDAGDITGDRAVLGARLQTTVTWAANGVALMTIAPGAFPKAASSGQAAPIEHIDVEIGEQDRAVRLIETREHVAGPRGITEAGSIVSGGRGLGKAEHFALVEELATELDASVGASGATVGAGWRSHADQVGSTGHQVSPKLYIAVGISGAPQHLVGIAGAETVVAINRDPAAPIFARADFGIVGDLFEVVPALLGALREPAD